MLWGSIFIRMFILLIVILSLLSSLLNTLVYQIRLNQFVGQPGFPSTLRVIVETVTAPQFIPILTTSLLISMITILLLSRWTGKSVWFKIRNGVIIGIVYVVGAVLSRLFIFDSPRAFPSPSYIGLSIIQILLVLLLVARITSPLVPDLYPGEEGEYVDKIKHTDRIILTIGVGLVLTIFLSIAPTDGANLARITLAFLLTPISLALLGIVAVGIAKIHRATRD